MLAEEFGRLVKALRIEHEDIERGGRWSQERLAQEANLTKALVGNIERGKVAKISANVLMRLANALHLTSGERKEFFAAASGIPNTDLMRSDVLLEDRLDEMFQIIKHQFLPAIMIDSYGSILALNPMLLALYDLQLPEVAPLLMRDHPLNIMEFLYNEHLERSHKLFANWDEWAYQVIMMYRVVCFRYRAEPYFEELLKRFKMQPRFRIPWSSVTYGAYTQGRDHVLDTATGHLDHPRVGPVQFTTSTITSLTAGHDLILYNVMPIDAVTFDAFGKLRVEAGRGVIKLLPNWKPQPERARRNELEVEMAEGADEG